MHKITVTSDCILDIVLNGAGGGKGGNDRYSGAIGSPGDKVTCKISASAGDVYYISSGKAGGNGVSGVGSAAGGVAGTALNGFSGGKGGRAGTSGSSGGGGGGGGATVLYKYTNEGYQYIAIAAGGAGGGGGGNHSAGKAYEPVKRVSAFYNKYYNTTDNGSWSSTLRNYAVNNGSGTYTLEYGLWSETSQVCTLYSSADDQATIYVNNTNIGSSASWKTTSTHSVTLSAGFNTLKFIVVNSGGGPTGYGAYLKNSSGSIIWSTRNQYNEYDHVYFAGRGGEGQYHQGDGGGAGGGGGGFIGGAGGKVSSGDHGANSGYPGVSYAMSTAEFNKATKLLKDQWEPLDTYSINILGGAKAGEDGSYSISSLSTNINVKSSGNFKPVYDVKYKTSSGWTPINEIFVKSNGSWVPLFAKDTFTTSIVSDLTENSISGYMIPHDSVIVYDTTSSYSGGDSGGSTSVSTGGVAVSDGYGGTVSASDGSAVTSSGDSGGGGGGGKIVCTAMNELYGFGSFRNQIWLKYSINNLTKAHEVGYHTLFLPLVELGYKKDIKIIRNILEHIARHRTADLRAEMRGQKRDKLGRLYRAILEPLCYLVGKIKGY